MLNNFTFLAHLNTDTNDSRTRNCTNQSVQKGPRDPKLQQVYQRRKSGTKMHGDCCRLLLPAHANLEEGCFKNAQGVSLALETSRGVSYSKHTPIGYQISRVMLCGRVRYGGTVVRYGRHGGYGTVGTVGTVSRYGRYGTVGTVGTVR